jgi:hypothetical protein
MINCLFWLMKGGTSDGTFEGTDMSGGNQYPDFVAVLELELACGS